MKRKPEYVDWVGVMFVKPGADVEVVAQQTLAGFTCLDALAVGLYKGLTW